jgi:hypothetical protein
MVNKQHVVGTLLLCLSYNQNAPLESNCRYDNCTTAEFQATLRPSTTAYYPSSKHTLHESCYHLTVIRSGTIGTLERQSNIYKQLRWHRVKTTISRIECHWHLTATTNSARGDAAVSTEQHIAAPRGIVAAGHHGVLSTADTTAKQQQQQQQRTQSLPITEQAHKLRTPTANRKAWLQHSHNTT